VCNRVKLYFLLKKRGCFVLSLKFKLVWFGSDCKSLGLAGFEGLVWYCLNVGLVCSLVWLVEMIMHISIVDQLGVVWTNC